MTSKISDLLLEQYLLQELPPRQMTEIRKQLQSDPDAKKRLAALEKSNRTILETYPAKPMAKRIQTRAESQSTQTCPESSRRRNPWSLQFMLPALSLLGLTLVLLNLPMLRETISPSDTIRLKGNDAQLFIYRKTGNQVELLKNQSLAHPGDLLQIVYLSHRLPYGMIFSIDGRQKVTVHFPGEGAAPKTPLQLAQKSPLPAAYELDDAPDFERFFFLTSAQPLDVPVILKSAQTLAQDKGLAIASPLP